MTLELTIAQESMLTRVLSNHIFSLDNGLKNLEATGGFDALRADILEEKRITEELLEKLNGC